MKAHVFALCLSLSLCLGLPLPALAFASPFTDVQETSPYYDAILWAAETGVTNGTSASTFSPDAPCTRAQLAVFLWRAAGEPKPALAEQQFMDVTDPSAYYYGAVQWAAEKDMWGFGTFAPHAVCTRLDAVFFLWRAPAARIWRENFPLPTSPSGTETDTDSPSTGMLTRRCCGRWRTASPAAPRRPHSPRTLPVPGVRSPHSCIGPLRQRLPRSRER